MSKRATIEGTVPVASLWTADDLHLFEEGRHYRLWEKLGSRGTTLDGRSGVHFGVWAPAASSVSVVGPWNEWSGDSHPLRSRDGGIWEGFVPGLEPGAVYKYRVVSADGSKWGDKADPLAWTAELPPATGSRVWNHEFQWNDTAWEEKRTAAPPVEAPISIYELHLGSWRRPGGEWPNYRTIADPLIEHLRDHGFTHVQFLPLMEHPFFGSWGYQTTGYFAATSRYGTPQDLMALVDRLHGAGIGVLFDWVPSHFPSDEHGLVYFDGTHLFEHQDPRRGWHPDWKSCVFDYGRPQVRSFLISSALYWLEVFRGDGLRVDAVSSMIYLNYSRRKGEWSPNQFGGNENLEAIGFLRALNEAVSAALPDRLMVAEESTSWPMVTRPTYVGGLGFGLKWDMGWMNDTLAYLRHDPLFRRYRHDRLTFRMMYAFTERFCLALSHDEVVHGKRSLLSKMPGSREQQFANLRLLLGYQWMQPGKKLLFMGGELAQPSEWNHDAELPWELLEATQDEGERHRGVGRWVADLNALYRREPSLYRSEADADAFGWVDCSDAEHGVVSWLRRGVSSRPFLVVCNLTPVVRRDYAIGAPANGVWREVLNSDATHYGGRGVGNLGRVQAEDEPVHGQPASLRLTLPGLAVLVFEEEDPGSVPAGLVVDQAESARQVESVQAVVGRQDSSEPGAEAAVRAEGAERSVP